MPVTDLLFAGLELMGLGMGIVFAFLVLLVLVLYGMSRVGAYFEPPVTQTQSATDSAISTTEDDAELAAVISTAIHRFRTGRRG